MKTITLVSVLLGVACLHTRGQGTQDQDANKAPSSATAIRPVPVKPSALSAESQAKTAEAQEKKVPVAPPKPGTDVLGKRIVTGGYLTDVAKTEKKRSLFNLRAPLDYQKDSENLSFYPNSEKVQGIILFSFKF